MRIFNVLIALVFVISITGCKTIFKVPDPLGDPKNADTYGYHPLDPLPINLNIPKEKILQVLPDETIRIAVGSLSDEAGITYGPAKIGVEGKNYIVILD